MKFQCKVLFRLVLVGLAAAQSYTNSQPIVPFGELWDYRVDGEDPGPYWNVAIFKPDNFWRNGPAPIGYDDTAQLRTDVGQPNVPRPSTYYFRKLFSLINPPQIFDFDLRMIVDDGAIVYINGVEVARYNMPLDVAGSNSAWAVEEDTDEDGVKVLPLANCEMPPLHENYNVLAVELHQAAPDSPDMRMDLSLTPRYLTGAALPKPVTKFMARPVPGIKNQVKLEWASRQGATNNEQYRILRRTKGDLAWEVISSTAPGNLTSYTDKHVKPDTTYEYQMFVVNLVTGGRSDCSLMRQFPNTPPLAQEVTVTTSGKALRFTVTPADTDLDAITMSFEQSPKVNPSPFTFTPASGTLKFLSTSSNNVGSSFKGTVHMTDGIDTTDFVKVVKVVLATTMDDCMTAVKANCQCTTQPSRFKVCAETQAGDLCDTRKVTIDEAFKERAYGQICRPNNGRHLRHSPNDDENLE